MPRSSTIPFHSAGRINLVIRMDFEQRTYRTSIATLIVVRPDLVEIHYDPGVVFDANGVGEVQARRREVMGDRPYATLTLIPDGVDFELGTMRNDYAQADRARGQLLASAVVVRSSMIEMLTKLYFSYFPQMQRILVTDDERSARTWLAAQMKEIAATGS